MSLALVPRPPRLPSELPVGLHERVPPEVYYQRELGVVHHTALDHVATSPATYKAWIDGRLGDDDTEALAFGRAFHTACLEPERFADEYAVQPDFGNCSLKGPKDARAAWRAGHPAQTWLSPKDGEMLRRMATAVHAHPKAAKLLAAAGANEVTLRWDDDDVGLPCKARLDRLVPSLEVCLDLKSSQDASEAAFARDVEKYGYHRQDALYRDGLEAVGQGVELFVFIVVEKTAPFLVGLYTVHRKDVEAGRAHNREMMHLLARCLHSGKWPGLSESIIEVRRPRWAR